MKVQNGFSSLASGSSFDKSGGPVSLTSVTQQQHQQQQQPASPSKAKLSSRYENGFFSSFVGGNCLELLISQSITSFMKSFRGSYLKRA